MALKQKDKTVQSTLLSQRSLLVRNLNKVEKIIQ